MQSVVAIVPCRNSIVVKGGKQAKNSDMHVAIMNWMWCYDESSLPFPPSCLLSFFFISVWATAADDSNQQEEGKRMILMSLYEQ